MASVVFGVWPLAGITSGPVESETARRTIRAALDAGIDTVDTAYSYGYEGEAEWRLGEVLWARPRAGSGAPIRVIGKVGQRWTADRHRYTDGSPRQLVADAETSLRRLRIDAFDWLLLHAVDPQVQIERSAEALAQLQRRGLTKQIGVSNADADQLRRFSAAAPCAAIQCSLNLLQRRWLDDLIPQAAAAGADCFVYWVLMKGLLAGRIGPADRFAPGDSRSSYDIFRGESRRRAHRVIDRLANIASHQQTTVARLAIGWALSQPGVSGALVGAKSPQQIEETATAAPLPSDVLAAVEAATA